MDKFPANCWETTFRCAIHRAIRERRTSAIASGARRRITPARASARAHVRQRSTRPLPILFRAVDPFIDRRNLLYPTPPLGMLEIEHVVVRPVKVIRDEGYLLIQRVEGVA